MKNSSCYVLGTGLSHDGSACLIRDGVVCVAIEKERITRRKHDGNNDSDAIRYCLDAAGIGMADLACIVQCAQSSMLQWSEKWFAGPRLPFGRVPLYSISHHLAHAYSAIGTSPFDEGAVLVIDGCGSSYDDCIDREGALIPEHPPKEIAHLYSEKDSYYLFSDSKLTPVYKDFSPYGRSRKGQPLTPVGTLHSLGGMYMAATAYCFGQMDDAGKLMGLAPYGELGAFDFPIFDLREGRVFVRYDWQDKFSQPARERSSLKRDFQHYANLACWVQHELERALIYLIRHRLAQAPMQNLMYAGGVALNAVANNLIVDQCRIRNLYVQPAAGDSGLALGCAFYGWLKVMKQRRVRHGGSSNFGKRYVEADMLRAISRVEGGVHWLRVEDSSAWAATAIAHGAVIGWFQGGSEFGPRALGYRSILADPRSVTTRDHINEKIKFREDFRPFAPAVTAESASRYFELDGDSPYMLRVVGVREEYRQALGAVTHVDGSARVQTVAERDNPMFYRLLQHYERISGMPILLNTSLNRQGMPIVETPEQAIEMFVRSVLDALVMGPFVVRRRSGV